MSQNLTLPFKYSTAFAVETHVNAGTIASSLALNPELQEKDVMHLYRRLQL